MNNAFGTKLHALVESDALVDKWNEHWRNYFAEYDKAARPFLSCRVNPAGVTMSELLPVKLVGGPRDGEQITAEVPFGKGWPDKITIGQVNPEDSSVREGTYTHWAFGGPAFIWKGWNS